MNIKNLIYTYLNMIHIIFILKINSFAFFQSSLKREIRFTKVNYIVTNTSFLTVYEATVKQYYDKQLVFIHFMLHKNVTKLHVNYSIIKCKEHYIDCYNVVSYDILQGCSNLNLVTHLTTHFLGRTNNQLKPCPLYGEYYYNFSIDADNFGRQFSLSTERYWEHYWKIYIIVYVEDELKLVSASSDFYFIEFRSRRRQN